MVNYLTVRLLIYANGFREQKNYAIISSYRHINYIFIIFTSSFRQIYASFVMKF